jgi:hypothetical protein
MKALKRFKATGINPVSPGAMPAFIMMRELELFRNGFEAPISARQTAAIHEAGHAVITAALGYPARAVEVFEVDGQWSGYTVFPREAPCYRNFDIRVEPQTAILKAAFLIAGREAEKIQEGADFHSGSSLDELAESSLIISMVEKWLGIRDISAQVEATVRDILIEEEATLLKVRDTLMTKGLIETAPLHQLLGGVKRVDIRELTGGVV